MRKDLEDSWITESLSTAIDGNSMGASVLAGDDHDATHSLPINGHFRWLLGLQPGHGESVRIVDVETVWNHTVCQVWVSRQNTVERLPAERWFRKSNPARRPSIA